MLLRAGFPEPPDDLKGGLGLTSAGRHDKGETVLAPGDGIDGAVDGVERVVARFLAAAVVVIVGGGDGFAPSFHSGGIQFLFSSFTRTYD